MHVQLYVISCYLFVVDYRCQRSVSTIPITSEINNADDASSRYHDNYSIPSCALAVTILSISAEHHFTLITYAVNNDTV